MRPSGLQSSTDKPCNLSTCVTTSPPKTSRIVGAQNTLRCIASQCLKWEAVCLAQLFDDIQPWVAPVSVAGEPWINLVIKDCHTIRCERLQSFPHEKRTSHNSRYGEQNVISLSTQESRAFK